MPDDRPGLSEERRHDAHMRLIESYRRSLSTATGLCVLVSLIAVGMLVAIATGWVRP